MEDALTLAKKIPWWGWAAIGTGGVALFLLFRNHAASTPAAGYSPSAVGLTQGMGVQGGTVPVTKLQRSGPRGIPNWSGK